MQKTPTATVSSGAVTPTIVGPDKDMKEIYVLGGLVLFLALVVAGFWYYSQADEAAHSTQQAQGLDNAQIAQVLTSRPDAAPLGGTSVTTQIDAAPIASRSSDVLHDDIFFEIGRKGLNEDARAALQRHADFLTQETDWGVLLQGYTDQQGSAHYNKILGEKRAESVKQQLMALGVSESAIRTVSLGEEGALCIDQSDTCRRINRRVHLELRKIGRDHLVIPTVAAPEILDIQPADPALSQEESSMTSDELFSSSPSVSEESTSSTDATNQESSN
jgi:peptidoglycan-associated lipoprotein